MNEAVVEHGTSLMEESPFAIPSSKLVMWLFIISDAVTFGAILVAYGFLRNATPDWPTPFMGKSILNAFIMTVILVTSSLTILLGVRAAHADNKSAALRWTFLTVAGGTLFALLHLREWRGLISDGLGFAHNPWGSGLFGSAFFSITGLHLTHVVGGIIALSIVAIGYNRGRYKPYHLEVWSLYWHFVDLVWMFVVPLVYLLNIKH
jgi:cytochrome c oxidase subunit 3